MIFKFFCCRLLQPECDREYDDSFENMELDVEGWRSESTNMFWWYILIYFHFQSWCMKRYNHSHR